MEGPENEVNLDMQHEELAAVEAIYGEDCRINLEMGSCEVFIPDATSSPRVTLEVQHLPSYPSEEAPLVNIRAAHVPAAVLEWAKSELLQQFEPGEVTVYNWVEWLKEQGGLFEAPPKEKSPEVEIAPEPIQVVEVVERSPADIHRDALVESVRGRIVHGEPFTERRSTFQAHVCQSTDVEEVPAVMSVLLENNKIRNATHNIMAYRIEAKGKGTFMQDYDDDGEAAAGGRLLHLLQVSGASDVIVVVSRWYGGILLGPARFSHINNAARDLLEELSCIPKKETKKKKK
ncbi:hypothetical protein BSKO_10255 [Bryopsis sp. KO-2023]|nr:hypothetical protein BSKO_10255 [Bryopsis sp. KO-2023]